VSRDAGREERRPAAEVRVVEGGGKAGWLSVVESVLGEGFALPPHVHSREDEVISVLEGEIRVRQDGGRERAIGAGGVVFLPRGQEHSFAVLRGPARVSIMFTPAGFEEALPTLWEAGDPRSGDGSQEHLAATLALYGCEVTGDPPHGAGAAE